MSLQGLLNQTINVYNKTTLNKFGRNSFGTATAVSARVQVANKNRVILVGQGGTRETIVIDAIAYVPANTTVSANDKVTYDGTEYKVFGRYNAIDGDGNTNHIKLELQKWA